MCLAPVISAGSTPSVTHPPPRPSTEITLVKYPAGGGAAKPRRSGYSAAAEDGSLIDRPFKI
jgi:hypothetical protein